MMNKNKILIDLSMSEKTSFGKKDFATQSFPQKVFSSIWEAESEINNGGFRQYFQNRSSAETASFIVQALNEIKAPKTADICSRAISCAFIEGLPDTWEAICATAGKIDGKRSDDLEGLSDEFMQYPHNLTDLLYAYVFNHPEEFGVLPKPE